MIEKLKAMLRRHEGLRLEPYQCSEGHLTIGYGHNLDSHGDPIVPSITVERAEYLLSMDIQNAVRDCAIHIPEFVHMDPVRQAVLIDMCFNLGIAGLLKFVNMLKFIGTKDWDVAALSMINSHWATQVKGRAYELARMMATGEWPIEKGENV